MNTSLSALIAFALLASSTPTAACDPLGSDFTPADPGVARTAGAAVSQNDNLLSRIVTITSDTKVSALGITSIHVLKGGSFSIAQGKTLTIDIPFSAGSYQIFMGAGTVCFSPGTTSAVQPQWWGALPDGSTDATDAIQSAMNAYPEVDLGGINYVYKTKRPLICNNDQHLFGRAKIDATALASKLGDERINAINIISEDSAGVSVENVVIEGLTIDMGVTAFITPGVLSGMAINISYLDTAHDPSTARKKRNYVIRDVTLDNVLYGIVAQSDVEDVTIDNIVIRENHATGIAIDMFYDYESPSPRFTGHFSGKIEIHGCRLKSASTKYAAIRLSGARDSFVHDNCIIDNKLGIEVYCNDYGESTENIDVHDNIVEISNDEQSAIDGGIFIDGSSFLSSHGTSTYGRAINVCGNILRCTDHTADLTLRSTIGIRVRSVTECLVSGNLLVNWNLPIDIGDQWSVHCPYKRRTTCIVANNVSNKSQMPPISVGPVQTLKVTGNTFKNWNTSTKAGESPEFMYGIDLCKRSNVDITGNTFMTDDGLDRNRATAIRTSFAFNCSIMDNTRVTTDPAATWTIVDMNSRDTLVNVSNPDGDAGAKNSNLRPSARTLVHAKLPYGTFEVGDTVRLTEPHFDAGTYYLGYFCTKAGTFGPATLTKLTGKNGEKNVTLTYDPTNDVRVGDFITVDGHDYRLTYIDFENESSTAKTLPAILNAPLHGDAELAVITFTPPVMQLGNPLGKTK